MRFTEMGVTELVEKSSDHPYMILIISDHNIKTTIIYSGLLCI